MVSRGVMPSKGGAMASMSVGRVPKRIGRWMSIILASLSCKRLSVSLAGGTSMMGDELQLAL
jgi:hypothetical protein